MNESLVPYRALFSYRGFFLLLIKSVRKFIFMLKHLLNSSLYLDHVISIFLLFKQVSNMYNRIVIFLANLRVENSNWTNPAGLKIRAPAKKDDIVQINREEGNNGCKKNLC